MSANSGSIQFTNPFKSALAKTRKDDDKDEWEDWDIDNESRSTSKPDDLLIDLASDASGDKARRPSIKSATRLTLHRPGQLPRVRSRARQKAQNAKAGITLVTDMTKFNQHRRASQKRSAGSAIRDRFADAVALRALEGHPSSPSIGSFSWLKRRAGNRQPASATSENQSLNLSPDSRPIVIGFTVPSEDAANHQAEPQTAMSQSPSDLPYLNTMNVNPPAPQQLRSVWSPDTEISESPYSAVSPDASVYSQNSAFGASKVPFDVPPVPAIPAALNLPQIGVTQDEHDEDSSTPCTPFEEDGNRVSMPKPQQLQPSTVSRESNSSRSQGWWDHVTTPFIPQSNNPFRTQAQQEQQAPASSSTPTGQEWWHGSDEKKAPSSPRASNLAIMTSAYQEGEASSSSATPEPHCPSNAQCEHSLSEKGRAFLEENDAPPPYEPPKAAPSDSKGSPAHLQNNNTRPIASPGPLTPGIPGTMTSQGGIYLADIPLTPSKPGAVLPDRALGSYRPGDHFQEALGDANKVERQRRRHEKEDVVARKVGGFWRGRWCIPAEGCFGRSGREGRKRRRLCLGIFAGVVAAIVLTVVLVLVLTHRAVSPANGKQPATVPHSSAVPDSSASASGSASASPLSSSSPTPTPTPTPTFWLNVDGFPPMPTGVFTIASVNNTVSVNDCFTDNTPPTAWSCAVPMQDDRLSGHSLAPKQPNFVFQIQYDNNSRVLWKLPDEASRHPAGTVFPTDAGITPNPAPPTLDEMRFLGNTTDHIVSDRKEGEPTPFYISLLDSVNKTIGANVLTRRQGNAIGGSSDNGTGGFDPSKDFPAPKLNPDGTGAPAQPFPLSEQQQLRLYDRGLPTEHYGFYTYYDKSIYLKNITHKDDADMDGGVSIKDASAIVTFGQTRFLVKLWTKRGDVALIESENQSSKHRKLARSQQQEQGPNAMPYPVTLVVDKHGGNQADKVAYSYGVTSNMEIDRSKARQVIMDLHYMGTVVNGFGPESDNSLGGYDGGTGGCRCEWINYEDAHQGEDQDN